MESTEIIIAKLVLGYLKTERCRTAYKEFLRNSNHLQQISHSQSKYLSTRFFGLNLEEILKEYFELYQIVQGRLEATNYFNEKHANPTLVEQVEYLLCRGYCSRTSTPCPRSPSESRLGETTPSYDDHISDVEATPAHTLPGNMHHSKDVRCTSTPKNKLQSKKLSSTEQAEDSADVVDFLAQTFLENRELQEKIAETINKAAIINTADEASLNKTVQIVMKETEEDPIFDQILDEILGTGTTNSIERNSKEDENKTGNSSTSNVKSTSSSKDSGTSDTKENCKSTVNTTLDQQNQEAVQLITEAAVTSLNEKAPTNSEVIVFDGPLDKYLVSNNCPVVSTIQNPVYLNTALLIPSNMACTLRPDNTQQFYVIPKPVTEQDIMTMPTVIVTEEKKNPVGVRKTPKVHKAYNPSLLPAPPVFKKAPQGLKKVIYPKRNSCESSQTAISSINTADLCVTTEQHTTAAIPSVNKQPASCMPEIMITEDSTKEDEGIMKTPPPLNNIQKVTPKSSSHVRNLDFSTPPKITSSAKKSLKSRHVKSPLKKQASKSLFSTELKIKSSETTKTWDADLRVNLDPCNNPNTPKRVRKRVKGKSSKKKTKKISQPKLNDTIRDGALLEEALQTPIKSEKHSNNETAETRNDNLDDVGNTKDKEVSDILDVAQKPEVTDKNSAEENYSKTILSPSKLNASKRNILAKDLDDTARFITPENKTESTTCPIKANRNIMPLLETPLKQYVKTPNCQTPLDMNVSNNMTPFTKMLEANLKCIDISQIPTPNLSITPSFAAYTPNMDLVSPFSNRPTDYSTGSSYYQPSDNEHNKSVEAQLLEMEKKPEPTKMTEHRSIFNKHVIGKKNLNLMRHNRPRISSSSDESESDSSGTINKESNDTVIFRESACKNYSLRLRSTTVSKKEMEKKTPKRVACKKTIVKTENKVYRKQPIKKGGKKLVLEENVCENNSEIKDSSECKESKKISLDEKVVEEQSYTKNSVSLESDMKTNPQKLETQQNPVLKELETKRLRTVEALKNEKPKKMKKQNNKFMKIKPIANVNSSKKKGRKSNSPKKNSLKEDMKNILLQDLAHSDDSDNDLTPGPNVLVPKVNKLTTNVAKNDISASDCEAQKLVEGLKERGIHLMHNKSPKKKTEDFVQNNMQTSVIEIMPSKDSKTEPDRPEEKSPKILEDVFDIVDYDTETLHVIFDESTSIPKQLTPSGKHKMGLYVTAEDGKEILVTLRITPFYDIFHLEQEIQKHDSKTSDKIYADVKTFSPDNNEKNTTSEATNDNQNIVKNMPQCADHKSSIESYDSENGEGSSRRNSKMKTSSDNIDSNPEEIEVSNTTNEVPDILKKSNIINNTNNKVLIETNRSNITIGKQEIQNKCSNVDDYIGSNSREVSIKNNEQSSNNHLCKDKNRNTCEVSDKSIIKKDSGEILTAKKSIATEIPSNLIKNPKKLLLLRSVEETNRSVASILPPDNENSMFSIEQSVLQKSDTPSCDIILVNSDNYMQEENAQPPKLSDDDLMDFAVMGNCQDNVGEGSGCRKRKLKTEESSQPDEMKRLKLLKKINVDHFLERIHGNPLN